ncbi:Adhesin [Vibrio crassostreae]|nr:Adhesin [Vibrio crassostreae]CAK1983015.1 Adhesin [Vibrio crassostreae]CAK2026771.1 Adhesin [Vibrio crassostreae]CAK2037413.1 Adhesin [Vibrio crassostreae]CAK2040580.1 Adhesin [Vibrio crassostreae]
MNFRYLPFIAFCFISSSAVASTSTLECVYKNYSDPEGVHATKNNFILRYLIDPKADKVYVLGNNGSNEVVKVSGNDHVSFLEATGIGNVMITTITNTLDTVHSRNTVGFDGNLIPSQYYGKCTAK